MTRYSYAQLEGLWIGNGGPKALAPVAAAIAEAESSGDSQAVNPTDNNGTQTSWGLWQISNGTHSQPVPNILDPNVNARQAVAKYKAAGGWSPWGTYTSGAYKAFLSSKTTPQAVPGGSGGGGGGNQPVQATATVAVFDPSTCLWSFPGIPIPFLGNLGQFCILERSSARAWIGAGILVAGGFFLVLPGVALVMVSAGMKALGAAGPALEKTGAAVALIPGAEGVGVGIAAAGKAGSSSAQQTQSRRQRRRDDETAHMRAVGDPVENRDLRVGRGAIRETPAETRRRQAASRSRERRVTGTDDRPPF